MTRKLVLGNWKLNGSLVRNAALLGELLEAGVPEGVDGGVCVPFPYLHQARECLKGSAWRVGAQSVSTYLEGAYTGEVSAPMLADFGCADVIVGHSERRQIFGEDDQQVLEKIGVVLGAGMVPVLCVGETLDEYRAGCSCDVVARQLAPLAASSVEVSRVVVAYEPVWAIGSGLAATPDEVVRMHAHIRECLAGVGRVLYGGSVKPANAAELFACPGVDGALVGGASLVSEDFLLICQAAAM